MGATRNSDEAEQLLGYLLSEKGIRREDLEDLLDDQGYPGNSFASSLVSRRYVEQTELAAFNCACQDPIIDAKATPVAPLNGDLRKSVTRQIGALRTEIVIRQSGKTKESLAQSTRLPSSALKTNKGGYSLVVVSPGRYEGRSTVAAELALAFAAIGESTLLVDADLRQPSLHSRFGIRAEQPGLAHLLQGQAQVRAEAVSSIPGLAILPAGGSSVSNSLDLLSSVAFRAAMAGWRRRYDQIVIDSPAAESGSDVLPIVTAAGRALVIAQLNRSKLPQLEVLLRRLRLTGAMLVGGVLLEA